MPMEQSQSGALLATIDTGVKAIAIERQGRQHNHPEIDVIFCRHKQYRVRLNTTEHFIAEAVPLGC